MGKVFMAELADMLAQKAGISKREAQQFLTDFVETIQDGVNNDKLVKIKGQRRVSFEYTMFAGFNDTKAHADALIRMLRGLECRMNLIRFHKIPDFPYETSPDVIIENFKTRLNNSGITTTVRASRGEDILAACGMLAGQHAEREL